MGNRKLYMRIDSKTLLIGSKVNLFKYIFENFLSIQLSQIEKLPLDEMATKNILNCIRNTIVFLY